MCLEGLFLSSCLGLSGFPWSLVIQIIQKYLLSTYYMPRA